MKKHRRSILGVLFYIFILSSYPNFRIWSSQVKQEAFEHELIAVLASENPEVATKALNQIFAIGDSMISSVASCKGNRNLYWGYNLGNSNSQDLFYLPHREGPAKTHVTLEVTALYLLEAIFRKDLEYAQSPFLVDRTIANPEITSMNSETTSNRAWSSVDNWLILLDKYGISHLREKRINPLFEANASFWGSSWGKLDNGD